MNDAIQPYEEELIIKLREYTYYGIPLSIVLLSKFFCLRKCHYMSAQLTKAMDDYKYVSGNISFLSKDETPNHTWVEKEDFVYDVTDCKKWKKDVYYKLYNPEIVSVYTKDNIHLSELYNVGINMGKCYLDIDIELLLQVILYIELEQPNNYDLLLREINLFREKNHFTKEYYEGYVKKIANKYLKSIN